MSSLTPTLTSLPSPLLTTPVSVVTSSTDTVAVSSTVSNSLPSTSASPTLPPVGNGETGTDIETSTVSVSTTPGSVPTTATSVSSTGPLTTPSPSSSSPTSISQTHTSASTVESSETTSPVSSQPTFTQTGSQSMSTTSTRTPPVNNGPGNEPEDSPTPPPTPTTSTRTPPVNNGPGNEPDASPTPPPTPTSSNSETTTMSTPAPTSTRTPPPGNNGEEDDSSSSTTTRTGSSSTSTGRPTSSPSSPPASPSNTTRPTGSGSSTTTREGPSSPSETTSTPVTRTPTSTVTSVTVIRTQSRGTTSTTLTLRPTSTYATAVPVTETFADGSVVTTIPPFVTVYSTRTEADGSLTTETQIVANPPGDVGALDGSNRGVLSRAGAAAGIFATVGVLVTALGFIAFLLWRRRRQTTRRQRWLAGMRQQRPDSIGGYPFGQDPAPLAGRASGSQRGDGPPGLGGAVTSDDDDSVRLPWDERRRIPSQRAEMRERGAAGAASAGLAGAGSAMHYSRGAVGGEQNRGNSYDEPSSPFGTGSRLTSNNNIPQDGSVNRNPFTGGILGLTRSGSASTTSSAASHTRHGNKNSGQASTVGGRPRPGSINKNSISLPVPVPSPTRKPAVYTDDPFGDKLGLSPITERTSIAPSSVNFAGIGTTAPPSVTSSNWGQRQHLVPPHSPAPSTPSMYPPTLPADDEMDDTGEFDSDATMEKGGQKQSAVAKSLAPSAYNDVTGYNAFQNLFVVPSRPKAPAPAPPPMPQLPPISRVPPQPLKINTNTNALGNRESTTSLTAPPRPPRSILRTSANGSLSALSSPTVPQAKRSASTEFIPLTPPASTPNHSPNPTYTLPGSIGRSGSWSKSNLNGGQGRSLSSVGQPQQQASPPLSPVVAHEKVQEMLANRRLLLDRRLEEGALSRIARESGSGSD